MHYPLKVVNGALDKYVFLDKAVFEILVKVLSRVEELRLGVFERTILRRIYEPICEGVTWRSR